MTQHSIDLSRLWHSTAHLKWCRQATMGQLRSSCHTAKMSQTPHQPGVQLGEIGRGEACVKTWTLPGCGGRNTGPLSSLLPGTTQPAKPDVRRCDSLEPLGFRCARECYLALGALVCNQSERSRLRGAARHSVCTRQWVTLGTSVRGGARAARRAHVQTDRSTCCRLLTE